MATTKKHGGRRHGLALKGRADRLSVSLSPSDRAALDVMAHELGVTASEAVRVLIREAAMTRRAADPADPVSNRNH